MTEAPIEILLIDDDAVDRNAVLRYIRDQRLSYAVTAAETLGEARALLLQRRFDAILSDYMLDDGTGLDILKDAGGTPVIFVTGHGDETIAAQALRQGAYDYIIKDPDRHYLTALPGAINNSLMRRRAELAVVESEKRNRVLLENLPVGVYQTTPDGEILYANPALIRMLGYASFEELSNTRLNDQNYDPRFPRQLFIDRMRSDGRVVGLESAWHTKQGQPVFVRESATAVTAPDGSILFFEGSVEDTTERRKAEDKEKQYLRELSVLYETTSLLNSLDSIDGMYQYLGEMIRELTGNPYLIICRLFPDDQTIRIHATWGFEALVKPVTDLIGFNVRTLAIPVSDLSAANHQAFTSGRLVRMAEGIYELSVQRLPQAVCVALERLLNVSEIHTMGFSLVGHLYGGVIFLLRPGETIENRTLIETVINQGAMAIQRKMAEEQLRQSEEFSRTVIEHSPVGITVRDRSGKLLSYNDAWKRICKLREEDLPRVRDISSDLIVQTYASLGADAAKVGEVFRNGGSLTIPELRAVDQDDGMVKWLSQQIYGIVGPDGAVDRVVTLTEDVSERKKADEEIRNKEEYYRALIKNSSDIITILNPDQSIRYASPSMQDALGYRPEEVIGRKLLTLVHPDDAPRVRRAFRKNLKLVGMLAPLECR
ncbi:MAG: PAS domain S-box protein, partial [Candidatus Edwardsbacteria bacterium]|nr:PAS domain S-box protein [Candidatus Edwardsbacteria bacterium]